ncbi:ABC transporter permease [Rubrivirga sp. S365]|uniref:ABC transporter permease n=1 Tax=Rubrivirga litoralis TaxID=3075598 RepID=A0ABU3BQK4_9BACT|nr:MULTISPECIES: ABC transporter permease [unclassified Rubrivirga]MDT0631571.1 ABC transporter permease [Rubrivirga sp. F394]MDT7857216.1 ABC transporter permease [Rubrivirga sp. S365]
MIGPFERTLALRYLRGAQGRDARRGFLRFVVLAAVGGVAVGTGALLLAVMIVRGFSREIEAKIVGFGQEVQVESFLGTPLEDAAPLVDRLAALPGVERATPAVVDFALLRASGEGGASQVDGVLAWGTEADAQPFVAGNIEAGAFSFAPDAQGLPGLVVGQRLAERLGLEPGQRVTAFSTRGLGGGALASRPYVKQFHVAGVYETGLGDFDDSYAFVSLGAARELFRFGAADATRIDLTLADRTEARAVADAVTEEVGPPVYARPIEDVYRGLFAWVELQQSIVPLVISILVVVAAFNIVGALLMVVLEKAQEIGTVLAMGASRAAVRRMFVLFGFLVGVIGAAGGAAVALGFAWVQTRFELIELPEDAYYLSVAPVEVRLLDVALTVAAAVALCTLAAYVPARAASRVEPIQVIRFGG